MIDNLLLPSMRGLMGDWAYYSCLMKFQDIADRVEFAERLVGNANLGKLLQRELKGDRAQKICRYLTDQPQRFFGSLIVASHGGAPEWFQLSNVHAGKHKALQTLPEEIMHSLGILKLTGKEQLFALDGQHRLAGIQKAILAKPELGTEEINVIFVAHHETAEGRARSRRLFTTLNKKAIPVRIGEIIALDEDDVMAVTTRRLVREYPLFMDSKVSDSVTANIPVSDKKAFTTLATLYSVLKTIFTKIKKTHEAKVLLGERPDIALTEIELDEYYQYAKNFFDLLCKYYEPLKLYRSTADNKLIEVVANLRRNDGGHVLFRPVGLKAIVEAISTLSEEMALNKAVARIASCPTEIAEAPFKDVLWRAADGKILHKGTSLGSRLLLYMIGKKFDKPQLNKLIDDYSKATDSKQTLATLPKL